MARVVRVILLLIVPFFVLAQTKGLTTMQQVFMVKQAFPDMKTIGILCNTQNASQILKELNLASTSYALELVVYHVDTVQDLRAKFEEMTKAKKIDILWMVPDGAADQKFGRRFLEEKSISNKIPLYAYSVDFVKEGSLMTVGYDSASQIKIFYNPKVGELLGVNFPAQVQPKLSPTE